MVVTARRAEAVQDFVEEFGDRAVAVALDVTDAGQIAAAVAAAQQAFGGIDVLVNNAGHGYLSAVEEGEDAEVRKLFDVNYFGSVDMIKAVLPSMRARGSGHIVNISSMTGLVANPPNAYYSSTKFALEAVTEALATEVRPLGIKVTAVEPGAFRTDWATRSMKESGHADRRLRRRSGAQGPDQAVRRPSAGRPAQGRRGGADGDQARRAAAAVAAGPRRAQGDARQDRGNVGVDRRVESRHQGRELPRSSAAALFAPARLAHVAAGLRRYSRLSRDSTNRSSSS